jgi:signal transduction protein with GAF and PtsI domain
VLYISKGPSDIKNESVFTAIRDINEVLSLSNEPQRLLNMTLDTLTQVLGIECCWVQTINARKRSLHLAAERGFNSEMRREISAVDMDHDFSRQVVGLGNGIVIPDLSRDGRYSLRSFRAAGYKWLVAAPLMTYRIHGVLGIASRHKKRLRKETPDIAMVIAGLIGTALNKADLSRESQIPEKPVQSPHQENRQDFVTPRGDIPSLSNISNTPHDLPQENVIKPIDGSFHQHAHQMNAFRRRHH